MIAWRRTYILWGFSFDGDIDAGCECPTWEGALRAAHTLLRDPDIVEVWIMLVED